MVVNRLSASFAACVTLLGLFYAPAGATVAVVPPSGHLPAMRDTASQARAATTANYALRDLGAPGPDSVPQSFNNTGQIVGHSGKNCVVWTGRAYRTLPFSGELTSCGASGINDANTVTGQFEIVGGVASDYLQGGAAFAALADASGETKATIYYYYPNATFGGVNSYGVSLGLAGFAPADTRELSGGQLFTNAGATHYFTPLQAPVPSQPPVHYLLPEYTPLPSCAFGGCLINDRNEVIGADYFSAESTNPTLAIYTVGVPSSFTVLPIGAYRCCLTVAFNNKSQILLYVDPAEQSGTELYDVTTRKMTLVPTTTHDCPSGSGRPIGLNNAGVVLGSFSEICPYPYFTWDPTHGTQAVQLPASSNNSTIAALGINDKREILVYFLASSGIYDWGILEPVSPSATLKTRARTNQ